MCLVFLSLLEFVCGVGRCEVRRMMKLGRVIRGDELRELAAKKGNIFGW